MQNNLDSIETSCKAQSIIVEKFELIYSNSFTEVKNLDILKDRLGGYGIKALLLDLSTMPRELIWNILTYSTLIFEKIDLIYHKPKEYAQWLCRNFEKPVLQIGHSGISRFGKPTALIIITGFDPERTKQLINHFEPDIVYLGIQIGSQFENIKRNIEEHKSFLMQNLNYFELDSFDINSGDSSLNKIVEILTEYNIIISSQGPKLSSVITYNSFVKYSNVGLAYVPSKEINLEYSKGIMDNVKYEFK